MTREIPEWKIWKRIAASFRRYARTGLYTRSPRFFLPLASRGICSAIDRLFSRVDCNDDWFPKDPLFSKINAQKDSRDTAYLWPVERFYAKNRADLCERFAKEALEESKR